MWRKGTEGVDSFWRKGNKHICHIIDTIMISSNSSFTCQVCCNKTSSARMELILAQRYLFAVGVDPWNHVSQTLRVASQRVPLHPVKSAVAVRLVPQVEIITSPLANPSLCGFHACSMCPLHHNAVWHLGQLRCDTETGCQAFPSISSSTVITSPGYL
jgi:hypothetical protein